MTNEKKKKKFFYSSCGLTDVYIKNKYVYHAHQFALVFLSPSDMSSKNEIT